MERLAVDATLETVIDAQGVEHGVRDVLSLHYGHLIQYRLDVEEAIAADKPLWRCPFCAQPVGVRCQVRHKGDERSVGAFHFQHVHHNPDCPGSKAARWSQAQILAAKYHGQREGPAHRRLKELLVDSLLADARFSDVQVETTWRGSCQPDKWRRPDVSARFLGQAVVFEIQLSTTFISVMAERRLFYRNEGACLVWIVAEFDPAWATLAHESVFYPNNSNIFLVTDHSRATSVARQACHFEVIWSEPVLTHGRIDQRTGRADVDAGELTVDLAGMRVFYFDVEGERQRLEDRLAALRRTAQEAELAAKARDLEQRRARFRRDFERIWFEGLQPARSTVDYVRSEREWRALVHPAALLGIQLPDKRHNIAVALNIIYSARDVHARGLVGSGLGDLVKLAHYVHTSHKPLLWPFRQALLVYGRAKMIEDLDPKGTWQKKVPEYRQAMLRDDPAYRVPNGLVPLLSVLFPELADSLCDPPSTVLEREAAKRRGAR